MVIGMVKGSLETNFLTKGKAEGCKGVGGRGFYSTILLYDNYRIHVLTEVSDKHI